MRNVLGRN